LCVYFTFYEQLSVEIDMSRLHFVFVAVAASWRSRWRAGMMPLKSNWVSQKKDQKSK